MPDHRPSILDVTEEQIFKTLGHKRVPICDLLDLANKSEQRSIRLMEEVASQLSPEQKEHSSSLQAIKDTHIKNSSELIKVGESLKC